MNIVTGKLALLARQVQQALDCRGKVGRLAWSSGNDFAAIGRVDILVWSSRAGLTQVDAGFLRL